MDIRTHSWKLELKLKLLEFVVSAFGADVVVVGVVVVDVVIRIIVSVRLDVMYMAVATYIVCVYTAWVTVTARSATKWLKNVGEIGFANKGFEVMNGGTGCC